MIFWRDPLAASIPVTYPAAERTTSERPGKSLAERWAVSLDEVIMEVRDSRKGLEGIRKRVGHHLAKPVVSILARTGISPSSLTWVGFLLNVAAAALVLGQQLMAAGLITLIAGFFDTLDGALARHTGRAGRFGAVLDSTLDRLSEAVLLLAILVLYVINASLVGVLLVGASLVFSFLVSYIRARAEALGLDCRVGLVTRPERVIILALGLLLNQLIVSLGIVAVMSLITAGQRLVFVWRMTKAAGS
jgi:CDP-diacylglycerol--glycerol-3-phosphate 3-phosphatidyltransferase